jgi:membrane protease YdiL (CAAX protease family)
MALTDIERESRSATHRHQRVWSALAAVEVVLAAIAVVLDLLIPTFVLLGLAGLSLLVRRTGFASLGLSRPEKPTRLVVEVFAVSVLWTLVTFAVTVPVVERLTGERRDVTMFETLEGNLGLLIGMLALSWTVAAFGEELAYRGFVLTRLREVLPGGVASLVVAAGLTSLLFGLAHTEQGAVGVVLTTIDSLLFIVLRLHYRTLWASVLAHGFLNTIGMVTFFLVGPVYGLW